jgi:hypothetical protein
VVSRRDFGLCVLNAIRTGVPELNVVLPITHRTLDITDEVMLSQRRERIRRKSALAEHVGGKPIRRLAHGVYGR